MTTPITRHGDTPGDSPITGNTPAAATANHVVLDGSVHTDTAAGTVVRGDLVIGNATPKWARVALGANKTLLQSDGTDAAWVAAATALAEILALADLSDVTAKTGTGTIVVMSGTPTVVNMNVSLGLRMAQAGETWFRDNSNSPIIGLIKSTSAGTNRNYVTFENNESGSDPSIGVKSDFSTDANVGLNMVPLGEGEIQQRGHKIPGITVGAEPSTKTTGDFWFNNT